MTVFNLTPHDIVVYPLTTPDRIDPAEHKPDLVIPPSTEHKPARLKQTEYATDHLRGVDVGVRYVGYSELEDEPPIVYDTWHVVSLVTALACRAHRPDFLVPYAEVRHVETNTVIGCRMLARPV